MSSGKELKQDARIIFGTDPEIFLTANGKVVGSERVIPPEGVVHHKVPGNYQQGGPSGAVRDGIQVELVVPPTHCRAWLASEICVAFQRLAKKLEGTPFQVSFAQVVDVDKSELEALSKDSRTLGCQPSQNWYEPDAKIGVDPETYTKRSAGGHIHLGLPPHIIAERTKLPPLLDILVGNTSVLIDRDPGAAERRQVYGRAGEFRTPRHGLEYRTLSNFWLRSKELVSLVFGLSRLAVWVLDTSLDPINGWPADHELLATVKKSDIVNAINKNDLDLARKNFEGVSKFIAEHMPKPVEAGLDGPRLDAFNHFIKRIDEKGLDYWFPQTDLLAYWRTVGYSNGWEKFLDHIVTGDTQGLTAKQAYLRSLGYPYDR